MEPAPGAHCAAAECLDVADPPLHTGAARHRAVTESTRYKRDSYLAVELTLVKSEKTAEQNCGSLVRNWLVLGEGLECAG